jgi:pimeloyl-ACP methyl ester carboxylesterase
MAVVATDYEGLGTSDPHPDLVGASEAHAVLDAARAATQVPGAGVTAASPTIIWGFSQGGHAAAFAGQLAPAYAPDLHVKGVVVAAPVSDVAHFARRAEGREDQFGVLVTIVGGFAHAYPELVPADVFTPEVVDQLPELERRCIGDINILFNRPIAPMLKQRPTERADFSARFDENQAGRAPVGVPVLVIQGGRDDIVDPADTRALVERWCASGVTVDYVVVPDANHGVMSDEPATGWTTDRLDGKPAPSTCTATPGTSPGTVAVAGTVDERSDG